MHVAYLSKFRTINIDLSVTDLCIKRLKFLAYIHPNVITSFGIALNFIILQQSQNPSVIFYLCLALRYLADCLDGGVAREYGKSSQLGGALDTLSDNILIFIVFFSFWGHDQIVYAFTGALFFTTLSLIVMFYLGALTDQSNMKQSSTSIKSLYAFCVNNSILLFVVYGISIWRLK